MSAPTDTDWGYCELCNGSFGDDELYLKLVPLIVSGQPRRACIAQFCIRCVTRAPDATLDEIERTRAWLASRADALRDALGAT